MPLCIEGKHRLKQGLVSHGEPYDHAYAIMPQVCAMHIDATPRDPHQCQREYIISSILMKVAIVH